LLCSWLSDFRPELILFFQLSLLPSLYPCIEWSLNIPHRRLNTSRITEGYPVNLTGALWRCTEDFLHALSHFSWLTSYASCSIHALGVFSVTKSALTQGLSRLGGRRTPAHYHTGLQSRMSLLYQYYFLMLNQALL
jgi:hypothetical protein